MSDPSRKVAIPTMNHDYKIIRAAIKNPPKVLNDGNSMHVYSICVWNRKPFFGRSNIKISNALIEGGIIQYLFNYLLDFEVKALEEPPKEPKVFEVEDLKFGFMVWLAACGVSVIAFLIEVSYVFAKSNVKKFIREFSGLYAFMTFFTSDVLIC